MKDHNIKIFSSDQGFPYLIKTLDSGEKCSVRFWSMSQLIQ